jgi:hypothetical protein
MEHGHEARTCRSISFNVHPFIFVLIFMLMFIIMQHIPSASTCSMGTWTRSMDTEHGYTALAFRIDMQTGHAAWRCSIFIILFFQFYIQFYVHFHVRDLVNVLTTFSSRMFMQHVHVTWMCSVDMQRGDKVIKHGYAAWIYVQQG